MVLFNSAADVRARLKGGKDPNERYSNGMTLLHRVARGRIPGVIRALVESGANPNAQDKDGLSPLHLAVEDWNPEVIVALLEAGADPNAQDKDGKTPLHRAARLNRNPKVIKALLEAGADPNARAEDGKTPLHRAVKNEGPDRWAAYPNRWLARLHQWGEWADESPEVIMALLDGGADPKARDKNDKTPFDLIADDSRLQRTEAYWRLHDARFD